MLLKIENNVTMFFKYWFCFYVSWVLPSRTCTITSAASSTHQCVHLSEFVAFMKMHFLDRFKGSMKTVHVQKIYKEMNLWNIKIPHMPRQWPESPVGCSPTLPWPQKGCSINEVSFPRGWPWFVFSHLWPTHNTRTRYPQISVYPSSTKAKCMSPKVFWTNLQPRRPVQWDVLWSIKLE